MIGPGTYTFGPANAELLVHTGRQGTAKKVGHDLLIEVSSWSASLELAEDRVRSSLTVSADGGSLRVREGRGGVSKLGDGDVKEIEQTIEAKVLRGAAIEFRSTAVSAGAEPERLRVAGELEIAGTVRPIELELAIEGSRLTGEVTIAQSEWGIRPHSALLGALKVADEVIVTVDAELPASARA